MTAEQKLFKTSIPSFFRNMSKKQVGHRMKKPKENVGRYFSFSPIKKEVKK